MLVIHPTSFCDICVEPYSESVSSEPVTSPHVIPCGHIFCLTCLHSLTTSVCPICRGPFEPDRVKKLHLGGQPEQDNAERGFVSDHASLLLHRMSLVSGDDIPEVDVVEVVSEVEEWLQSQPDDPNSHIPLRAAVDSLQRYKALQHESERKNAECRRLREQLRNSTLSMDRGSRTSRVMEDGLLSRIEEIENALELSQLRSRVANIENPQPRYQITSPALPPRPIVLPRTMDPSSHMRTGHPIVISLIIFFSIIELSISAWLTSRFTAQHNYFSLAERDRTRFLLFTSTWTIVFSGLHMFIFFYHPGNVLGSMAAHIFSLFLTWAFWTAGATSITAALSGELNRKLVTSSYYLPLTSSLPSTQSVFAYPVQLNALEGFAWVTEALVTFALILVIIRGILAARRGDGMRGPLIA